MTASPYECDDEDDSPVKESPAQFHRREMLRKAITAAVRTELWSLGEYRAKLEWAIKSGADQPPWTFLTECSWLYARAARYARDTRGMLQIAALFTADIVSVLKPLASKKMILEAAIVLYRSRMIDLKETLEAFYPEKYRTGVDREVLTILSGIAAWKD